MGHSNQPSTITKCAMHPTSAALLIDGWLVEPFHQMSDWDGTISSYSIYGKRWIVGGMADVVGVNGWLWKGPSCPFIDDDDDLEDGHLDCRFDSQPIRPNSTERVINTIQLCDWLSSFVSYHASCLFHQQSNKIPTILQSSIPHLGH